MGIKPILFLTLTLLYCQLIRSQIIGYANLNGGTTGGAGGPTVTVSTAAEFISAVTDNNPRIVRVVANIFLEVQIRIGSNKSILGAAPNAGFTNGGLFVRDQRNVIIRGLRLSFPRAPNDCIEIQRSTNVWVDHNELFSTLDVAAGFYDGLIDINHGSDFITVSWNRLHNHHRVSLIGHSDNNEAVDRGRLHVTIHNNHFVDVGSRLPSLRFGTAHIFNNLYENVPVSTINSRMGAQCLVEYNVFINARRTLITNLDSREDGFANERNNDWGNESMRGPFITQVGNLTNPPYAYTLDTLANVPTRVRQSAGATISF